MVWNHWWDIRILLVFYTKMQQKEQKCFSAKRPARLPFFRRILYLKFPVKQYSHAGSRRYTFLTESQDVYFVYPECSNVASIVPCALWKDTRAIPCKCQDYHGKIKLWAQEQKCSHMAFTPVSLNLTFLVEWWRKLRCLCIRYMEYCFRHVTSIMQVFS